MSESNASKNLKSKLRTGKVLEVLTVLILAVVVAALMLSYFTTKDGEDAAEETTYAAALEERLGQVLSQIDGAGNVEVFITAQSAGEKVIATETTVGEDGSVTTVPVLSGGEVIVLEELNPEITGVLIVAEGGGQFKRKVCSFGSGGVRSEYQPKFNQGIHKRHRQIKTENEGE